MSQTRKLFILLTLITTLFLVLTRFPYIGQEDDYIEGAPPRFWGEYDLNSFAEVNKINNVVFIFGLGGSGTRGVASLFEEWGCSIHFYKLNSALDNTLVFRLNPYVDDILNITGTADYQIEELPQDLISRINETMQEVLTSVNHMLLSRCVAVKWPRIIYLLPVLKLHFPNCKFVQVVRDGRDMVLSRNTIQYKEFSRFYITPEESELPKPFKQLKFWYMLNMQVKTWMKRNAPGNSTVLRIESLVLDADEEVYRNLYSTSFDLPPPFNLSNNVVFTTPIAARRYNITQKYGKYKYLTRSKDIKLLYDLQTKYKAELEEFGYVVNLRNKT